jgi:hypothetical protein
MKGEAPALVIGLGRAEPGMGDRKAEMDEGHEAGGGVLATTAFCKAHMRGDYKAAYEAFKEMLLAADQDLEADESPERSMEPSERE